MHVEDVLHAWVTGRLEYVAPEPFPTTRLTTSRRGTWKPIAYNLETRRAYCKACGTECPNRRRLYCTDACRDDYSIRNMPAYARQKVWDRDRGVCALCGVDTITLKHVSLWGAYGHRWEMDHIIPVIEGGGQCGLENLRTLCIACHRRVTAELRARIARHSQRAPFDADLQMALPLSS